MELNKRHRNVYDSYANCANAEGIDIAILKKAKANGCTAFRNSRIYMDELQEWMKTNQHLLQSNDVHDEPESIAKVKLENLIKDGILKEKDGILKDLEIKRKKESLVTVEEMQQFMRSMATAQMALFNRIQKELPVKLSGKTAGEIEAELTLTFNEIINVLKSDFTNWK